MEQYQHPYFLKTKNKILGYFILLLLFFFTNSFSQVLEKDTIVYGSDQNFPPYEFLDNKGNPAGFNVELMKAIAEEMGFNLKIKLGVWADIKNEFETKRTIDIVDMYYSKEREKIVDFAVPHEVNYDELYVRKGEHTVNTIEHLKGKRVAAQAGSTLIEYLISNYPELIVVAVPSEPEALIQLSEGKCDAAIVSQIIAHQALKKHNIENVVTISRPVLPRELSFAVIKRNDQLLKQINTGLFRLKENGKLDKLKEKWIEKEQKSWIEENIIPIGVILAILAIVILSWVITLRYTIRKRTNELQQEIEEREKIIKTLHESEEKFKALYHESPDMFVSVSPIDASILQCNETLLQKTGFSREEVIGAPIFKMYHEDCMEDVKKVFQQFVESGIITEKELILKTKKGSKINVSLNVKSIRDKTGKILFSISSWRDITNWKKLNIEVNKSYEMMLNTIENMSDGFVSLDTNWIYTYVNERAASMFGKKPEELIGKHIWTEFPDGVGQPFYHNYYKAVENQELISFEDYYQPWDRWFVNNVVPSAGGISIFFNDITERKKSDEELLKYRLHLEELVKERTTEIEQNEGALLNLVDDLNMQTTALNNANKKLASINAEMETFTYSVSHDLKAPLRGIDGYSQLLIENYKENLDFEAQEFLMNIRNSTEQMNVLIEDLLAYSRMERRDFEMANLYLNPIIDNILHQFSKVTTEKKIQIKITIPEEFKLIADKEGLQLSLRNLIDNAIKFSKNNKKAKIEIGGYEDEDFWHIFVKDNGIGFDMKYHDRIFKIFQRLHLAEEYEGTGIGLAMVYKALYRMNGRVWAKSELNKGSCFHLEINKTKLDVKKN